MLENIFEDKAGVQMLKDPGPAEILRIIFRYISKIANERDLNTLVILLADMGRELVCADRCTVWLIDDKNGLLWSMVAHGLERVTISKDSGIAGYVASSGKQAVINDPYGDSRFDKDIDEKTGYRTKSIIALPIQNSAGRTIGVFQAINKITENPRFNEDDVERLLLASTYTGKQLEAAILQAELEDSQKEIILTLAETGEMRSKETGNHVKRIAEISKLLALKYGLGEAEAELIRNAAPLHDIGKIAIPDSILLKPAKLTSDEWEVMKTHEQLGFEILKHSERNLLKAAAIIARDHHEKWDGSGYSHGLCGNDIHLYGRIVAIADVFDALTNERCYKKAWPAADVIEYFKEQSGRHFDPDLTGIFLANMDEVLRITEAYRERQDQRGDQAGAALPDN